MPKRSATPSAGETGLLAENKAQLQKMKEEMKRLELANEKEVGKLGTENGFLKDKLRMCEQKLKEYESTAARETSITGDAQWKELLLKLKDENERLRKEIRQRDDERQNMEQKFIETKVKLTDMESSVDASQVAVQHNEVGNRIAALEAELVKTKQELGEAMNREYEHEARNMALLEQLQKCGVKEGSVGKSVRK